LKIKNTTIMAQQQHKNKIIIIIMQQSKITMATKRVSEGDADYNDNTTSAST